MFMFRHDAVESFEAGHRRTSILTPGIGAGVACIFLPCVKIFFSGSLVGLGRRVKGSRRVDP